MKKIVHYLFVGVITVILSLPLSGVNAAEGILSQIPYNGTLKLANGDNASNGNYDMIFKAYTVSSGGVAVWTESHDDVPVSNGVFSLMLGSISSLASFDFNQDTYYFGISINGGTEMTPRQRVGASAYAFNADKVDGADAGTGANNILKLGSSGQLVISSYVDGVTYLELTPGDAPATPSNGQIYYDSTGSKMYGRINGAWVDLGQSGGSGGDFSDGGDIAGANRTLGNTDNYDLNLATNNKSRLNVKNNGALELGKMDGDAYASQIYAGNGSDTELKVKAAQGTLYFADPQMLKWYSTTNDANLSNEAYQEFSFNGEEHRFYIGSATNPNPVKLVLWSDIRGGDDGSADIGILGGGGKLEFSDPGNFYFYDSNNVNIFTVSGEENAVTVKSGNLNVESGNLGVGTITPDQKLDVNGDSQMNNLLLGQKDLEGAYATIRGSMGDTGISIQPSGDTDIILKGSGGNTVASVYDGGGSPRFSVYGNGLTGSNTQEIFSVYGSNGNRFFSISELPDDGFSFMNFYDGSGTIPLLSIDGEGGSVSMGYLGVDMNESAAGSDYTDNNWAISQGITFAEFNTSGYLAPRINSNQAATDVRGLSTSNRYGLNFSTDRSVKFGITKEHKVFAGMPDEKTETNRFEVNWKGYSQVTRTGFAGVSEWNRAIHIGGVYSGTQDAVYEIEVVSVGSPNAYRWRKNAGTWQGNFQFAAYNNLQEIDSGIKVGFGAVSNGGLQVGDKWTFTAYKNVKSFVVKDNAEVEVGSDNQQETQLTVNSSDFPRMLVKKSGVDLGYVGDWDEGGDFNIVSFDGSADGLELMTSNSAPIKFSIGYQEKMRVNTAGKLEMKESCMILTSPDGSQSNCCVDDSDNFTCTGI